MTAILSQDQFNQVFPVAVAQELTRNIHAPATAADIFANLSKPANERFYDYAGFRNRVFERHSNLSAMLSNGYLLAEKWFSFAEANERLRKADNMLTLGDVKLSSSDSEICQIAEDKARACELKLKATGFTYRTYKFLAGFVQQYTILAPDFDCSYFECAPCDRFRFDARAALSQLQGAINRMCDPIWWRRRLRNKQALVIEQLARDLRLVHKKSSPYCSKFTITNRRDRKAKTDELMSDLFVVPNDANPFQDFESLKDVAGRSHTSGPQLAAELMVRIRGFQELAQEHGHRAEFYTLTAPSRFHAVHHTGIPNQKYDGSTPQEAQEYFNAIWKKARARFAKLDIRPYGFRVVEPHHDGCPHWHMLLFMEKGQAKIARAILRDLCTLDTPNEFKTTKSRFKAITIDPRKGSAAGYIAKYITKAVSGDSLDKVTCSQAGELNVLPADAAESASTWASTFNLRRFQQIGGPSVTAWRELRRLGQGADGQCEVANAMNTELDTISRYALEKVRAAADTADWKAFCLAMGGVQVKRKDQTVRIHYQVPDIVDQITGEISRSESSSPYFSTKYGDQPANRIIGVAWDSVVVITRRGNCHILTEKDLKAQRKIMTGVSESIQNWYDDGRLFAPSNEEMQFLEACVLEDYQNMCLFMDYEALEGNISSDAIPHMSSEDFSEPASESSSRQA